MPTNTNDTLLRMIGLLGMILPFVLLFGGFLSSDSIPMQESISAYYHEDVGYLFVSIMLATGAFLISYRGADTGTPMLWGRVTLRDDGFTTISGILAILVAVLPAAHAGVPPLASKLHWIFAGLFLITMAVTSYWRFAQDDKENAVVHVACALIIGAMILVIFVTWLGDWELFPNMVWWLEAVAVVAFGFSWLVKSRLIHGRFGKPVAVAALVVLFFLAGAVAFRSGS